MMARKAALAKKRLGGGFGISLKKWQRKKTGRRIAFLASFGVFPASAAAEVRCALSSGVIGGQSTGRPWNSRSKMRRPFSTPLQPPTSDHRGPTAARRPPHFPLEYLQHAAKGFPCLGQDYASWRGQC